jgi:hypothetical protein
MTILPLIAKEGPHHGRWRHTRRSRLPVFYMNDFSRMGLRVHPCDEVLRVLEENRYGLIRDDDGFHVAIDGAAQVQTVVQLLNGQGVHCEIADVADQVYQG